MTRGSDEGFWVHGTFLIAPFPPRKSLLCRALIIWVPFLKACSS